MSCPRAAALLQECHRFRVDALFRVPRERAELKNLVQTGLTQG